VFFSPLLEQGVAPMLPLRSVKSLYPLALAEGEGIGTAYEYFAKRLRLAPWLATRPSPQRVLIGGLPEKYGSSLDFLLLAQELNASEILVMDDRAAALEKCRRSLAAAVALNELTRVRPRFVAVRDIRGIAELNETFDLCLSSEVLQRIDVRDRSAYLNRIAELANSIALFAPNGDNSRHATISGLVSLRLIELHALADEIGTTDNFGYVDMPPFPPGITRSAELRERASSGRFEQIAMSLLGHYARAERVFPSRWRRRQSHIVFAFATASMLGCSQAA
jgi:hypothetical protein